MEILLTQNDSLSTIKNNYLHKNHGNAVDTKWLFQQSYQLALRAEFQLKAIRLVRRQKKQPKEHAEWRTPSS